MDEGCPYQRVLGSDFETLPAILQRAHSAPLAASGSADVWRGTGLGGLLASLFRLPRAGVGQHLALKLSQHGHKIAWWRAFDGRAMTTHQWAVENLIHERAGPVRIAFQLHADQGTLLYQSRSVWFLGVQLPEWARPSTVARVTAEGRWWIIVVRIDHPLAGLVCEYRGTLEPQ